MTFVVVGDGFSGVEVAGELNDFLRASLRYYTRIAGSSSCTAAPAYCRHSMRHKM